MQLLLKELDSAKEATVEAARKSAKAQLEAEERAAKAKETETAEPFPTVLIYLQDCLHKEFIDRLEPFQTVLIYL